MHELNTRPQPDDDSFEMLVCLDHIDFMGHVNNVQYLRWTQNVALSYWHRHAPPDAASRLAWAATEHNIRSDRPAYLDDKLQAQLFSHLSQGMPGHLSGAIHLPQCKYRRDQKHLVLRPVVKMPTDENTPQRFGIFC